MKINLVIKKAEINGIMEVLETISTMIPEEVEFEVPTIEELTEGMENGRYYESAPYGSLLVVEDNGDFEVTVDLAQEFTTDAIHMANKIIKAASGIIGAVVGFAGTMKALGGKFISKVTSLGESFAAKWFAPAAIEETTTENSEGSDTSQDNNKVEEHENKYGVYPLKFLWDNNDGNARWGVVTVIVEKCDYTHSGFRVIDKKANVSLNSNFETTYEKVECQLFMDLGKYGFEPMFSDFNEARLEMLNLFDRFIREMNKTSDENEDSELSMDELEKACEGSSLFETPIQKAFKDGCKAVFTDEEYERLFGGKKATE